MAASMIGPSADQQYTTAAARRNLAVTASEEVISNPEGLGDRIKVTLSGRRSHFLHPTMESMRSREFLDALALVAVTSISVALSEAIRVACV
jgi:hypothetical protein